MEQFRIEGKNGFIIVTDRGEGEGAQILVNTGFNVAILEIDDEAVADLTDTFLSMCEEK